MDSSMVDDDLNMCHVTAGLTRQSVPLGLIS
jgi:hypothetical protein